MKGYQQLARLLLFMVTLDSNVSAFVVPSTAMMKNTALMNAANGPLFAVQKNHNKNDNGDYTRNTKQPSTNSNKTTSFLLGIWMAIVSSTCFPFGGGVDSTSMLMPPAANAATAAATGPRVVGQLKGSGLVFKDTLQIESFDDPKVKGVTLYISTFQRPLTERLTSSFMTDPSDASVGCSKTGKVEIADNIAMGTGGEEVFEESKSLLFKTLRVQRIYDKEKNTVLYISFNTRLDKSDDTNKSRFKSSICAVNLDEPTIPVAAAAPSVDAPISPTATP